MSLIEEYVQANTAYKAAKAEVDRIASLLDEVTKALQKKPDSFCFTNSNVGLPHEIAVGTTTKKADAKAWPTPDQINAAIGAWYQARQRTRQAWANVPSEMKSSLAQPDFDRGF